MAYVVVNENTLGIVRPEQPEWLDVLHGSVLRGGRNWKDGPAHLSPLDVVREATLEDFDAYRVCAKGHLPCCQ